MGNSHVFIIENIELEWPHNVFLSMCIVMLTSNPSIVNVFTQITSNLKSEWLKNGILEKENGFSLVVKDAKSVEKDTFSCRVSNPVSSLTSGAVKQNCTKPGEYNSEVPSAG